MLEEMITIINRMLGSKLEGSGNAANSVHEMQETKAPFTNSAVLY